MNTKFLIPITISALLIVSCGNKDEKSDDKKDNAKEGWSDDDKEKFHDMCVPTITAQGAPEEAAKKVCECSLDKISKEYSSYNAADNGDVEKIKEMMMECVEDIKADYIDEDASEEVDEELEGEEVIEEMEEE